jgi:hypothetical protein
MRIVCFQGDECWPLCSVYCCDSWILGLFVCSSLTTLFQWLGLYSVEWRGDEWVMNWKGCGKKQSWHTFMWCSSICLEGLSKTTTNLRISGLRAKIWSRDLPNTKIVNHSTKTFGRVAQMKLFHGAACTSTHGDNLTETFILRESS